MSTSIFFAGDINLKDVDSPTRPFSRVRDVMGQADVRFANLECSFYEPGDAKSKPADGLQAPLALGAALTDVGFDVVGTANNGNFGSEAILSTSATLRALKIAETGAGENLEAARRPAIIEVGGQKIGFLQRTSVYWPLGHEAMSATPGVAVLPGHTSYLVQIHRTGHKVPPLNRPGNAPQILTWADGDALQQLRDDIEDLRAQCDVVIASHHWGLKRDVLEYMPQIAHAAIDAGADAVIGHGPHFPMAVEVYKGCPIFYSLSSFCFNVGHSGKRSGDWSGMMARIDFEGRKPVEAAFRWVRHDAEDRTWFPDPADETANLNDVAARSAVYGTRFEIDGPEVRVALD